MPVSLLDEDPGGLPEEDTSLVKAALVFSQGGFQVQDDRQLDRVLRALVKMGAGEAERLVGAR